MRHRTQLYLDEDQYRWLKRQAGPRGSIAAVVRQLIDRARDPSPGTPDPLLAYLLERPKRATRRKTTVTTLDEDLYGS